jgi:hypothetical protein
MGACVGGESAELQEAAGLSQAARVDIKTGRTQDRAQTRIAMSTATATKIKSDPCDCIDQFNKLLEPKGTIIEHTIPWQRDAVPQVIVSTLKNPKTPQLRRVKAPLVVATYCPFCGKKYALASERT